MTWFEHNGSRIHYEVQGSGPPVLLLPGFSDRIADHGAMRARLSQGHRVIAADLPGSGLSLPQPRDYGADYLHRDAARFAALLDHLGAAPAHVLGFSDGGEVGLLMAALHGDAVRSVFAWGACGMVADPSGQLRAAMRGIVDAPPPPLAGYRDFLVATYGEANARTMTQSFAGALDAIVDRGGGLAYDHAAAIACPVFVAVGSEDMFVPQPVLRKATARIAGAEVRVVEGAGHALHHSHPDWLLDQAEAWLARAS